MDDFFRQLSLLCCPQARLPEDVTDYVEEDPTGMKAFWSRGLLNGASQKVRYQELDDPSCCVVDLSLTLTDYLTPLLVRLTYWPTSTLERPS